MKRDFAIAAKAVIMKEDHILLLHRSKRELQSSRVNTTNPWDLPGGGIHFFETVEQGLEREITEETGVSVNIIKPLSTYDAIRPHLHITIITYLCEYKRGEVLLSHEHDGYDWIGFDELETSHIPGWLKKSLLKAIEEYKTK